MAHVGLNVIEGVSSGLTPFNEASISNIGVLMERERGIANKVVMVDSLQEDRRRYGGIQSAHYGAYLTRHIFNNAGSFGAVLRGCRMYAGNSANDTATGDLTDGVQTSAVPETLATGLVEVTNAGDGEVTLIPEVLAVGVVQITNDGANGSIARISVDEGTETPIILAQYEVTGSADANAISAALKVDFDLKVAEGDHNYSAEVLTDTITITAPVGSGSNANSYTLSFDATGADAVAATVTPFADGADETPASAGDTIDIVVTIAGTPLIIAHYLVVTADTTELVASGLLVDLLAKKSAGVHGYDAHKNSASVLHIIAPVGSGSTPNGAGYNMTVSTVGTVAATVTDFSGGIDEVPDGKTIMNLFAGQEGQKDPGTWSNTSGNNGLTVKAYPKNHPNGVLNNYLIEVYLDGSLVEVFQAEDWTSMIDNINLSSLFIMSVPQDLTGELTGDQPSDIQTVTFAGGVYTEYATEILRGVAFAPAYTNGIPSGAAIFDGEDIQMLIQTEVVSEASQELSTLAAAIRDYCGNRGDVVHLFSLPLNASDSMVGAISALLQENLPSFAAGYHAWVKTSNENGLQVWTPGIGCIVGAGYIRTREMGRGFAWIPPAGADSALKDCSDITPNPLSREKVDLFVRSRSTNVAQFQKGYGFILMSSRTYSTNALYHSVHIRLMTNWLVKTLNNSLLWSIQKPNTITLRKDLVSSISSFFRGVYSNGGLETTIPFAEAVVVICDKTNNPPYQDRKILNVTIQWIPVECTEAVVIQLNRNDGMLIVKSLEV